MANGRSSVWVSLALFGFSLAFPAWAVLPPHGLTPAEVQKLKQLKQKVVVPGWLPQGFHLKAMDVKLPTKGQKPSYQLNYRCFCGGMNYGFAIMGGGTPLAVKQAKRPERQTSLHFGNLEYFLYDPHPPLHIRETFYLTRPFGPETLRFQVLSNYEGQPMRAEQWHELLKHLRYLP
jgi:hypothetical protein